MHPNPGDSAPTAAVQPHVSTSMTGANDESEFVAVYRTHYDRLVRTAFLLVDSNELAEEVVQDSFAKLYQRWERVGRPEQYLRRCVVNGCYDLLRRRRRERRAPRRPDAPVEPVEYLSDALGQLPPRQRIAIVLRYYEGLQEPEIAIAMRCPPGTVKTHLKRGLATLREFIDEP